MPSPYTKSVFQNWALPGYTGRLYYDDYQSGWKTLPGESRHQVLDYFRRFAAGSCLQYVGPPNSASVTYDQPFKGDTKLFLDSLGAPTGAAYTMTRNKAYARLREKAVGENSAIGVFAAERREAFGMVANRVIGLRRAYKQLRKGNFKQFLRELSVKPKRKHRSVVRTAASEASGLWLEYWFGWSPTVNDLYNVMEVLTQELPAKRYSGSARCPMNYYSLTGSTTQPNYTLYDIKGSYIARTGATIRLVNPNLFLLNQLGLANPLTIAWEVIPFSFVVDWFTKFGDTLDAFSDWVGLSVSDPYKTYVFKGKSNDYTREVYNYPTYIKGRYSYPKQFAMYRDQGLIKPMAVVPVMGNFGRSKTRAATAVSLLVQLFLAK